LSLTEHLYYISTENPIGQISLEKIDKNLLGDEYLVRQTFCPIQYYNVIKDWLISQASFISIFDHLLLVLGLLDHWGFHLWGEGHVRILCYFSGAISSSAADETHDFVVTAEQTHGAVVQSQEGESLHVVAVVAFQILRQIPELFVVGVAPRHHPTIERSNVQADLRSS